VKGKPFALRDACPHRGMPLSSRWFDGQNLEVQLSRLEVRRAQAAQCQLIPSLTSDQDLKVDRIYGGQLYVRGTRRFHLGIHS